MKIDLSGHHIDLDAKTRETIDSKFAKIGSHFPDIDHLTITITAEKSSHVAEVNTQYKGAAISVKASDRELYIAIRDAEKKLEAALSHRKGALSQQSHERIAETA